MKDLTEARLIQITRHFYPTGYPVTTDDYSQELHPYQRTPEYSRWLEAWNKAMAWPEWKTLIREMRLSVPNCGDCTQPRGAACRRCCVYLERPLPDGARHLTCVAAAASVLAPLYVTYCTTEIVVDKQSHEKHLFLELPEEVKPHAARLSALVERILGDQAFPLLFANVPVPGIRVHHTFSQEATLLDALFDSHLESLF
jgi:ribosome modulation factor